MTEGKNSDFITGQFTEPEENLIIYEYPTSTAANIAIKLNREVKSVRQKISQLHKMGKLKKTGKRGKSQKKVEGNSQYIGSLSDEERRAHFNREIMSSAKYRVLQKSFTQEELEVYREKYVSFMMDPTVETMTYMEKDMLHQWFVSEVRIDRFMQEEKESKDAHAKDKNVHLVNKSKEIKECQEIIQKCSSKLNVDREQRLKNQSDQAMTFTNLVRDLKNPTARGKAGREAAMLKYIAEKAYNKALGKNIVSGRDEAFDLGANFKNGKEPAGLNGNFTPTIEQEQKENGTSANADGEKKNGEGPEEGTGAVAKV